MISKNHKKNSNFQIAYFLIGSCNTPDGAYSLLCDLKEEREAAIDNYQVTKIREKAKIIKAKKLLSSKDEVDRLNGEADLLEIENNHKIEERLYKAAVSELDFINKCLKAIEPLRKYRNLPDIEAHEAMQFDEWKGEMLRRAENYLITTGRIPTDQFNTMRMHPAFLTEIMPRIKKMTKMLATKEGLEKLQEQIGKQKFKAIAKLVK